jgi:hypothetical protein
VCARIYKSKEHNNTRTPPLTLEGELMDRVIRFERTIANTCATKAVVSHGMADERLRKVYRRHVFVCQIVRDTHTYTQSNTGVSPARSESFYHRSFFVGRRKKNLFNFALVIAIAKPASGSEIMYLGI